MEDHFEKAAPCYQLSEIRERHSLLEGDYGQDVDQDALWENMFFSKRDINQGTLSNELI